MNKSPLPTPALPVAKTVSPAVSPRNSGDTKDITKNSKKDPQRSKSPRSESSERREHNNDKKERKSKDSKHHSHKDKDREKASPAHTKSPSLRLALPVPPAAISVNSAPPAAAATSPLGTTTSASCTGTTAASPPMAPFVWKRTPSSNSPRKLASDADALPSSGKNIGQTRYQRSSPRGGNPKVTCIGPYQFDRTAPLGRCTFLGVDTRFAPPASPGSTPQQQVQQQLSSTEPETSAAPRQKYLQVVVKVVEKRSPAAEYLKLEYQLLKCFDHPHVIRVLDSLEDDTCHYFVTEYLSGGRLMHELGSRGKLGPEDLLRQKITAVVSAVQYNHHMRAVIYRELLLDWIVYFKPENVYVGSQGLIKVGPFGYLDPKKHPRTWVRQWSYASFAAPEILTAKSYLMAVDCWSLGILLHLMATGAYPFHGATAEEMIAAVYQQSPPLRNALAGGTPLSADLTALLTALLAPHPYKRLPCSEILKHAWFNKAPVPVSSMGLSKASNATANQPAPLGKSVKIADSHEEPTSKSTRSSIFGIFSSSSTKPHDSKEPGRHRTATGPSSNTPATAVVLETKSK